MLVFVVTGRLMRNSAFVPQIYFTARTFHPLDRLFAPHRTLVILYHRLPFDLFAHLDVIVNRDDPVGEGRCKRTGLHNALVGELLVVDVLLKQRIQMKGTVLIVVNQAFDELTGLGQVSARRPPICLLAQQKHDCLDDHDERLIMTVAAGCLLNRSL